MNPKTLKILTLVSYCCIVIAGDHVGGPYILILFYSLLFAIYDFSWNYLFALFPLLGMIGLVVSAFEQKYLNNKLLAIISFLAMLTPFVFMIFDDHKPFHRDQTIFQLTLSIFIFFGFAMLISIFNFTPTHKQTRE